MNVQPINSNISFSGKLINNVMLDKFKESLNDKEKDIFTRQTKLIEDVNDGREFIYVKCLKSDWSGEAVGIFEKYVFNKKACWLPVWTCAEENSKLLFDHLVKLYKKIYLANKKLANNNWLSGCNFH